MGKKNKKQKAVTQQTKLKQEEEGFIRSDILPVIIISLNSYEKSMR